MQHANNQLRSQRRQFVMQRLRVVIVSNRYRLLQQHRAGVETGVHLHDGDAGFTITGEDSALDGCCAAPARQQGCMNVEASQTRQAE